MAKSNLKLDLVIKTPLRKMFTDFLNKLAANANRTFGKTSYAIIRELRGPIGAAIIRSPEMASLQGGRLAGELGLPPALQRAAPKDITEAIVNSIGAVVLPVRRAGRKLTGGINITVQPADFRNMLGLGISPIKYLSRNKKFKGKMVSLDWLDWLLFKGDAVIVQNFRVERGSHGRSGLAKMKGKRGNPWRIDPNFSGTVDDNFISRALDDPIARGEVLAAIQRIVKTHWGGR